MLDTSAWRTILTLGAGVALAAGIAYAFLHDSAASGKSSGDTAKKKKPPKSKAASSASKAIVESDDDITDTAKFKGYKQTKSGQTTTYFNRELSERDKALLGDSTPRRISAGAQVSPNSPTPLAAASTPTSSVPSSAWNAAGTWEERDVTQWATACLRRMLTDLRCLSGNNELLISEVKSVSGDASIAVARGKRKNIYDFAVELDWKLSVDGVELATGSASLDDVSAACEHEVICRCNGQSGMSSALKATIQDMVLSKNSKLKEELNITLKLFLAEFEQKVM